jgi:hypothetical protein
VAASARSRRWPSTSASPGAHPPDRGASQAEAAPPVGRRRRTRAASRLAIRAVQRTRCARVPSDTRGTHCPGAGLLAAIGLIADRGREIHL